MKISDNGVNFIIKHEGFRSVAYKDQVGKWTTGYGHLIRPQDDYFLSHECSKEMAWNLLKEDLAIAEQCIKTHVKVVLEQWQYDALVSFIYNVGCAAFGRSTLLLRLNQGEYDLAAAQLLRWDKGGGKVVPDLTKRREDEQRLFKENKYA